MAKLLKCNDLNPRCIFEIRGNSEAEVLEKAAEHFQVDHNMQNISPDILSKARRAIAVQLVTKPKGKHRRLAH
jgi:predicted small metal-binding protein